MSSSEDDANVNDPGPSRPRTGRATKKRRVALACDMCRKRKIRCDGKQASGKCSNCTAYDWVCVFIDPAKKFTKGYVEALEAKVRRLEDLLKQLHPNENFTGPPLTRDSWNKEDTQDDTGLAAQGAFPFASSSSLHLDHGADASAILSNEPNRAYETGDDLHSISQGMIPLDLDLDYSPSDDELNQSVQAMASETFSGYAFRGKSSAAILVDAMLKMEHEMAVRNNTRPSIGELKRSLYWSLLPWERQNYESGRPLYTFPDHDLFPQLISAYFENSNVILPVLHRPTLEDGIRSGQHFLSEAFGGVVLLACAVGARFSSDPRVIMPGTSSRLSAGWAWFSQVRFTGRMMITSARLHDLQMSCLGAIYMLGSSAAHASWHMIGIGIRLSQDIGAHRKSVYGSKPTVEGELIKRSFWVLVCLDRWISSTIGAACSIQEEDFDLEMPVDCDDEYWMHPDPDQAFKQPPGKPSLITAFICNIKLCQIVGYSLRNIYASNKARAHFRLSGEAWEQRTITRFDSILNQWVDSVPNHLRWDPNREDEVFMIQSAHLYAMFYDLQISVHKPFISPRKPSSHSFPSIAICVNAARSCSRVLDQVHRRWPSRLFPFLNKPLAFTAIVLLLGIWQAKQRQLSLSIEKELIELNKCLRHLEDTEDRWHPAGRIVDVLRTLILARDLPSPTFESSRDLRKRTWEQVGSLTHPRNPSVASSSFANTPATAFSTDSPATMSSIADQNMAGLSDSVIDDTALPLHINDLRQMGASDPLGWDLSSFFADSGLSPPATESGRNDTTGINPTFLQSSTASMAGAGRTSSSPGALGADIDFGALFGFGALEHLSPTPPPPTGFGFNVPTLGATSGLSQGTSAAPGGGSSSMPSFGMPNETNDLEWLIPMMLSSEGGQAAQGQDQDESFTG